MNKENNLKIKIFPLLESQNQALLEVLIKKKVKQSRYRPGVARRVPGS
jgi:hypothetical protein